MTSQYMRKIIESFNEVQEVDSFQSVFPSKLIDTQRSVSGTFKTYQLNDRLVMAGGTIIFKQNELIELSKYDQVRLNLENNTIETIA